MAITSATRDWGTSAPNIVRITATNTLAEVAATGYVTTQADELSALNSGTWEWLETDLIAITASDGRMFFQFDDGDFATFVALPIGNGSVTLPVVSGDFAIFDGTLGALEDGGFSPSDASKTKVVMAGSAVQVGYIAHFVDVDGTIDDTAGAVINAGNIQAGLSGTAGTLISYPATAANGTLIVSALNAGGAFNTTIRNSVMGQSSVISIPDPGAATANFVLDATAGGQSIAGGLTVSTGNFAVSAGTITASGAITSTAGNITSGSSGDAGTFISFPATAANGTLILAAANAGAAFNTTISNGTMGQSTVYTLPDIGAATGGVVVSTAAVRMKMVADAAAAGGSATQNFVDAFCTAASVVVGNWQTQANPASILTIVPGVGSFDVVSSADAGVGTFNYVIMK